MGQYYDSFIPKTALHEIGRDAPRIRSEYSDEELKEAVSSRLAALSPLDFTKVRVAVADGRVTLSGSVESERLREIAHRFADRVPGVRSVENLLDTASGRAGARHA